MAYNLHDPDLDPCPSGYIGATLRCQSCLLKDLCRAFLILLLVLGRPVPLLYHRLEHPSIMLQCLCQPGYQSRTVLQS